MADESSKKYIESNVCANIANYLKGLNAEINAYWISSSGSSSDVPGECFFTFRDIGNISVAFLNSDVSGITAGDSNIDKILFRNTTVKDMDLSNNDLRSRTEINSITTDTEFKKRFKTLGGRFIYELPAREIPKF